MKKITVSLLLLSFFVATPNAFAKEKDLKTAKIAVPFVKNEGQEDEDVAYYANTFAGTLYVTEDGELVYSLPKYEKKDKKNKKDKKEKHQKEEVEITGGVAIKETLVDANTENINVQGEDESETKISYFKGSDKDKWNSGAETSKTLNFGEVYSGIEMKLKAYNNNVEKLFYVSPNADPSQIKLQFEGTEEVKVNKKGELVLETELGEISFSAPIAYQEIDGKKEEIGRVQS